MARAARSRVTRGFRTSSTRNSSKCSRGAGLMYGQTLSIPVFDEGPKEPGNDGQVCSKVGSVRWTETRNLPVAISGWCKQAASCRYNKGRLIRTTWENWVCGKAVQRISAARPGQLLSGLLVVMFAEAGFVKHLNKTREAQLF